MSKNSIWILIGLTILVIFVIVSSLISYYFSKTLTKWLKNVKRIDDRKDLGPKTKEIVRIVQEVSRIYKISMPEVGIYPSQEINAFATGPAGNTLIAFSTNLIEVMSIEEIRGVVGHELSHLIHYDIARILIVQGIFDFLYWVFSFLLFFFLFQPKKRDEESGIGELISFFFKMILFRIITTIFRLIGNLFVLWYNRKRELAADKKGAEVVGIDDMLAALNKLLELENKSWVVDGMDLTEDERTKEQGEPNSISLLKFNPEKKKRGILDLFRTHPTLEERIEKLNKLKKEKELPGVI
ncbi:MAG: M48 family metalloprotease [Spiroplasmataceae bacterium]|nr:M48 family metalloprotease [Spiroplasmataceae bacterium]